MSVFEFLLDHSKVCIMVLLLFASYLGIINLWLYYQNRDVSYRLDKTTYSVVGTRAG
jgi:hypothetical protein